MAKNTPSIFIKHFPTLGDVAYKIATTPQEMEAALSLVYQQYIRKNLINPKDYKSPIRIGCNHILRDETRIFIGVKNGEVIITLSTFQDSPLGLPMDCGYGDEAQSLRQQGRKISEAGYFAVKNGLYNKKELTRRTRWEKLIFMFTIFRMAIQYGQYHADVDDACIVTNPDPKSKEFKHFPLDILGDIKHYGFDEMHINPKPAIAKRINFRILRPAMNNPLALCQLKNLMFRIALGKKIPDAVFQQKLELTPKDLHYFFVEKSDILKNLKPQELEYVLSSYHLSHNDYKKICP
jgi:hypothetical protein